MSVSPRLATHSVLHNVVLGPSTRCYQARRRKQHGYLHYNRVVAAAAPPSSEERAPKRPQEALLAAVAASNRGGVDSSSTAARNRVLKAVEELESSSTGVSDPTEALELINGRWALVYSTRLDASQTQQQLDSDFIQKATGEMYKVFFKFAPFLAGSQGTGGKASVSNEQIIDLENGLVDNRVLVKLPFDKKLSIRVYGEVEPLEPNSLDLKVTFTGWEIGLEGGPGPLKLPLPRPVGSLRTTFIDQDIRIGRGGRGGVFVTLRIP
mmetsp:Transcript_34900/g.58654  ORF Transcript_34900/g.58654 Transcript_34900/m.58654 type:complete len:266 (+) Transcript_34900:160-957(+)|eukprot:CAMPEP_0198197414 /NCGR_PEP_ID=MMETSP1445-20131203/1051_1 /TAXON_ID=36898 /ORGANISM="Pyramimonas sp., Strain CCMP2087" /LENGTH=265 /DNA_ID=CAMNT_0043866703 /DNA_START=141 /DNA_END=938 /DNA_ORIENTATION=-